MQKVNEYGEAEILTVLPLCMTDQAALWYEVLLPNQHDRMVQSVTEWIKELRYRFAKDPLQAKEEAARCKHSFDREDVLPLREYITKKQTLLYDAGEDTEHGREYTMIRKI